MTAPPTQGRKVLAVSAPSSSLEHPHAPWWAVAIITASGVLVAIQSRVNSQLAEAVHSPYVGAAVSFTGGLLALLVVMLPQSRLRAKIAGYGRDLTSRHFPWHLAIGGLIGAFFVFVQSLVVGVIGVAMFIVGSVAGQTVCGLALDRIGFAAHAPRPLAASRIAGAALMIVAVVLALSAGLDGGLPWHLLILPLLAGCGVGYQTAANGAVTRHTGHYLVSALGNFVLGSIALTAAALASLAFRTEAIDWPSNPLLYTGGLLGLVYISASAALVKRLGVLVLSMSTIAGQIIGSVLLDALTPGIHLGPLTLAGAALTLVATGVTAGLGRKAASPSVTTRD